MGRRSSNRGLQRPQGRLQGQEVVRVETLNAPSTSPCFFFYVSRKEQCPGFSFDHFHFLHSPLAPLVYTSHQTQFSQSFHALLTDKLYGLALSSFLCSPMRQPPRLLAVLFLLLGPSLARQSVALSLLMTMTLPKTRNEDATKEIEASMILSPAVDPRPPLMPTLKRPPVPPELTDRPRA